MAAGRYKYMGCVEEDHGKAIFCIAFNLIDPAHKDVFAAVGAGRATVYKCLPGGQFQVMQAYTDEDKTEQFFVCKWCVDEVTGAPLLLIAGQMGVVRVLDCARNALVHTFSGHGNSINDISIIPQRPSLFITASKDESIRLWNLRSRTCVLVMSGEGGHKNEVLTLDWHPWDGKRFLSAGMDSMVKVWNIEGLLDVVDASDAWQDTHERSFPTKLLQHPVFSSVQIHANYVDCVRWLGDLCLSKSVDGKILLWRPTDAAQPGGPTTGVSFEVLQAFPLPDSHVWFLRFSLDAQLGLLACGNRSGVVTVYDPHAATGNGIIQKLHSRKSKRVVRQTAVSWDGGVVLACSDDAAIWRWDRGAAGDSRRQGGESASEDPDTGSDGEGEGDGAGGGKKRKAGVGSDGGRTRGRGRGRGRSQGRDQGRGRARSSGSGGGAGEEGGDAHGRGSGSGSEGEEADEAEDADRDGGSSEKAEGSIISDSE